MKILSFTYKLLATLAISTASFVAVAQGYIENPAAASVESGIGIISGFHCTASEVDLRIDGKSIGSALVGSDRGDTASLCGKSKTGYSYLINFNIFTPGNHTVAAYSNGVKFDEKVFRTLQSGGTEFLTGVTKNIVVQDFPKTGVTSTLSWSQSKQSFTIVGSSGTATPPPTPTPIGIAKLYGAVTFNYKFASSSTIYNDSVFFSSANLSDGILIGKADGTGWDTLCDVVNAGGFEFLCAIFAPDGWIDAFLFNVNSSRSISGYYTYCPPSYSAETCATELATRPDGTVTGIVSNTAARSVALSPVGQQNLLEKKALTYQTGSTAVAPKGATPISAISDPVELEKFLRNSAHLFSK